MIATLRMSGRFMPQILWESGMEGHFSGQRSKEQLL
jgi:hypothetical protein